MLRILNCVVQEHDLRLVALSALICVLGCFTTVVLLSRGGDKRKRAAWWIAAAAGIFGCSIWSLHFVAMLAFMPGMAMSYDLGLTAASVAVPVLGSWAAMTLFYSRAPRLVRVIGGGLLLGSAITGMHYIGVAAMRFSGFLLFDYAQVANSVLIASVLPVVAAARSDDLSRLGRRLEVAAWLTIGICGLHFTGMSAVTVAPGAALADGTAVLGTTSLAVAVGGVSLVILLASLVAVMMEQHLAQRAVQELARMRLLSNLSHEVMMIQRDGIILEVNSAGERLFKAAASALVGRPVTSLVTESSLPILHRRLTTCAENLRPEELEIEASDGAHISVEVTCQAITYLGQPARAFALRDLTDRKRDEARIRHLARHDALTGLPNRYTLQERLELVFAAAAQDGTQVALLYLDFDRFKPVNDLFGHAVGDALLMRASKRIQVELGGGDMLARIGGDEFVVVIPAVTQPEKAERLARRIIEALAVPFQIEGNRIEIGVSAGIALYPSDADTPDALLRAADTAMYRVKDEGRGTLRFFEASMNEQLQARRRLEQELGGAIEAGELMLHYQPIVDGASGEVEGFEALLRWNHSQRGLVPPIEFIPLAEETGLISRIGTWVIDAACAAAAERSPSWRVSINVSPVQFRHGDLCATIEAALDRHRLRPDRLIIEMTEGVLMENTAKALETLNRLRSIGVGLALDDFGTGFSSLSYLQLFRFDKFKIDKSFVNKLGTSEDTLTIVRTIVNLGHNLGLAVTAEGVETAQQLAVLQSLGCDHIQGYLVARPAPVDTFGEIDRLRTRSLFRPAPELLSA